MRLAAVIVMLAGLAHGATNPVWVSGPAFPDVLRGDGEQANAVHDGKIYVIGGNNKSDKPATNAYSFDGTTWTAIAPPSPVGIRFAKAVSFQGYLWCIGGSTGAYNKITTNTWKWDGSSWANGPALPEPRSEGPACVFQDRIWYFGGASNWYVKRTNVWACDGTTWTWRAAGPTNFGFSAAAVYAGKIYHAFDTPARTNIYTFDGTNWAEILGLPVAKVGCMLATNNEHQLIAYGGGGTDSGVTNTYAYDGTNWSAWPACAAKSGGQGINFTGALYAVAGGSTNTQYMVADPVPILTAIYWYGVKISHWCGQTISAISGRAK